MNGTIQHTFGDFKHSVSIPVQVHAKEVNKFQLAYMSVLRANADNLKKREKEKKTAATTSRATAAKTSKA